MTHIPANTRWSENGITVAGCGKWWIPLSQLSYPCGLCLDNSDGTLFIADSFNHRIVAWTQGGYIHWGRLVAGGYEKGNGLNQLNCPTDVLIDKDNGSLIICDRENRRVMRWSLQSGTTQGQIIIDKIDCHGLAMDNEGYLYITDVGKHEVRRYRQGEKGTLVAGGNGKGDRLNQLNSPQYVFVDDERAVYVSDFNNHRVMKWVKGAIEGIVVAGDRGTETDPTQLLYPQGVFVDAEGIVYVADVTNHRVTRWRKEKEDETITGGNEYGGEANKLYRPIGLSFDRDGHLYVADYYNHRIQRFDIVKTPSV